MEKGGTVHRKPRPAAIGIGLFLLLVPTLFNEITFTFINPYVCFSSKDRVLFLLADLLLGAGAFLSFLQINGAAPWIASSLRWARNNWYFLLFLFLLAFGAMEVSVRFAYPGILPVYRKAHSEEGNIYEKSDYFAYQLKKNLIMEIHNSTYNFTYLLKTDPEGFRGGPLRADRPNILALGDSVTFGFVNGGDTFPARLQSLLGDKVNVYNAGVPGWGFAEYSLAYGRYVSRLKPKVVIVAIFSENDFDDLEHSSWPGKKGGSMPVPPLIRPATCVDRKGNLVSEETYYRIPLLKESAAIDFARFTVGKALRKVAGDMYMGITGQPLPEELSLAIVSDMARRKETKLLVLLLPSQAQLKAGVSPMSKYARAIRRIDGVEVVDLFSPLKDKASRIYLDRAHLTPEGNALVAEEVFRFMTKRRLLQNGPDAISPGS